MLSLATCSYLDHKIMHHFVWGTGIYGVHLLCVWFLPSLLIVNLNFIPDSTTFVAVIVSVFLGAIIVTFNIKILGGKISYFQAVSILGYCICPIFLALIAIQLLKFLQFTNRWIKVIMLLVATVWSIFGNYMLDVAARSFIGVNLPQHKKFVGLYPIFLYYAFIAILMIFRW